jgi:quinol monooxygenase YgiN
MLPAGKTFIPDELLPAHHLCLLNHDILVELLRSGEKNGAFIEEIEFRDRRDRDELDRADDVFEWLERTGRSNERARVLRRTVFPALLSDFLHFIFEALETSRKAKLNVSYALIRKPLQENLFLLETISTDPDAFTRSLLEDPLALRAQKAGGVEAHARRISNALNVLGEQDRFDAAYLAQLRYDRKVEDGFDGSCNKAIHLFTEHPAIRTESLNINFIFSDWEAKLTQWYYLYSRLPYLLFYARLLVEHVCSSFVQTDPSYLANMERRVAAGTLLWARNIDADYRHPSIERFVEATRERLARACRAAGHREPSLSDLPSMVATGGFPA